LQERSGVRHKIAVIAGDGVGKEVIPEGMKVLSALVDGLTFELYPWGSEFYEKTGRMMPEDALDTLRAYDAIYLGACGWPTVPDHVSLWGLLLPIRKAAAGDCMTGELGGKASTTEVGDAIVSELRRLWDGSPGAIPRTK
jgi:isocitrate/isopropylmalate dehydrogenase